LIGAGFPASARCRNFAWRTNQGRNDVRQVPTGLAIILACGLVTGPASAETRTVTNGLEVHETALIVNATPPTHMLSKESCTAAEAGWKIDPASVTTQVVTARMMDPSGDPDWKVEKAEGQTRIEADGTRICLAGYCQGPLQFQCEIQVRASWQETK
jgi:hypothetical protein